VGAVAPSFHLGLSAVAQGDVSQGVSRAWSGTLPHGARGIPPCIPRNRSNVLISQGLAFVSLIMHVMLTFVIHKLTHNCRIP
jgi:hypothetical protein